MECDTRSADQLILQPSTSSFNLINNNSNKKKKKFKTINSYRTKPYGIGATNDLNESNDSIDNNWISDKNTSDEGDAYNSDEDEYIFWGDIHDSMEDESNKHMWLAPWVGSLWTEKNLNKIFQVTPHEIDFVFDTPQEF